MFGVGFTGPFSSIGQHVVDSSVLERFLGTKLDDVDIMTMGPATVRQLLYFLNNGSHSSVEEFPRM